MVGEADLEATDPARGYFATKSGYTSKWWSDAEIEQFKGIGQVDDELVEDEFHLLRLSVATRDAVTGSERPQAPWPSGFRPDLVIAN
jgi:hypothetical protein